MDEAQVSVRLDWQAQGLEVEVRDDGVVAVAHPSLSEAQVQAACADLGPMSEPVLAAWRSHVGITQAR